MGELNVKTDKEIEVKGKTEIEFLRKRLKPIKYKIIILSGKGGVGKSTVTANLAVTLAKRGYSVGVFDYDFHGPAIPRMLGASRDSLKSMPLGVFPATGVLGIKVVSIAFLLPDEKTPVIWRGPLKFRALRELLANVIWGQLDYLLFDLPPGTGDEALNIAQTIPDVSGAIVVTIPSEISRIAVEKSVEFCKILKIRLLGVIENMSYLICPSCGHKIEVFGKGGGERIVKEEEIPLLGRIPLDPDISMSMDSGSPIVLNESKEEVIKAFKEVTDNLIKEIELSEQSS